MTLLVFDIDGTLTNTKAIDDVCFINSVRECWGCNLEGADWSTYLNVTDTGLARDIFRAHFQKEISDSEIAKLKNIFSSKIIFESGSRPEAFTEISGAAAFIREAESRNLKFSFATGGWRVTAEHKLKQIGLDLTKFPYATSDDHYARKEIMIRSIENAQETYRTNFNRIIYFGDGVWDLKASAELNIDFIGIDFGSKGKLRELGAKVVFTDFSDKESILDAIRNMEGV